MMGSAIAPQFASDAFRKRLWLHALIALAVTIVAIAALFRHEISGALNVWSASTAYNHCFLVIPIVGYLCWQRRASLSHAIPSPCPRALIIIFFLSCIWFFAAALDVLELRQFLFIAIIQAAIVAFLGTAVYKKLLGPLLYLFFLVPSGEFLVPSLQDFTARFSVAGLKLVNVPVYADGTFIQIPEGTFVIAEACAGLRFLIASIAFGVLFSLLVYRSWKRRAVFIGLSLVIPVIANGIRAFGIIFAAHLIGSARAAVADHILYGWLFFSIVIFLLTLVGMSFAERPPDELPFSHQPSVSAPPGGRTPAFYVGMVAAAITLAALGPVRAMLVAAPTASTNDAANDLPSPAVPWQITQQLADWRPKIVGADGQILQSFSDGRNTVDRYVALYVSRGMHNNLGRDLDQVADGVQWRRAGSRQATVKVGDVEYSINATEIRWGEKERLVWSFYVVDGKPVAHALGAKLRQAYTDLIGRGRVAAFVAISTPMLDATAPAADVLRAFLNSSRSLDTYLAQAH